MALKRSATPAFVLFALSLISFARRSVHGIHFFTFGDESGHFVGARAIHAGDRLYRDFIDAHGPLVFIIAHAFGFLFGWAEPLQARWAMVAAAALAGASIATSTALTSSAARLWGGALFFGLIAAPWLVQALDMVNYHLIGGVLVTIILAWLVIPAWTGAPISHARTTVTGLCLAWLCADAYSLAPSAILLAAGAVMSLVCTIPRAQARATLLALASGFAIGALLILAWLLRFGDLIGYLVFHIIDNQVNYARYSTFGWSVTLRSLIPSLAPDRLVQSSATIACLAGFGLLACTKAQSWSAKPRAKLLALAPIIIAVLMLNFRGASGFQDGSFLVASNAVLSLALPRTLAILPSHRATFAWAATACLGLLLCAQEAVCRAAITSPGAMPRSVYVTWPKIYASWPEMGLSRDLRDAIFQRIRQVLRPDERLLVLIYNPSFFLSAGFLPMRKYHDYLPWEADYARAPWFGRDRDLCVDLARSLPPIIVYDGWVVWGHLDPKDFIPCLAPLLARDYVADPIANLYIRRDRLLPA